MTKCKPPIFGDSAVLKKGLWVTLVIALVLALYGALFTPTWQTRAFTIDAAAQTHLHPLTDGETFTLPPAGWRHPRNQPARYGAEQ